MLPWEILLTLVFGSCTLYGVVSEALYSVGLWKIFAKCGEPSWHALIPAYKEYAFSRCSDREMEGRTLFIGRIIWIAISVALLFPIEGTVWSPLLTAALLAVSMVMLIYSIRIRLGAIEVFAVKKKWIILWVLAEPLAALIWGFFPKYRPQWKVQDIEHEAEDFFSGSRADVLENGLTVNLEERTAVDFFKKKYLLRDIHMYIKPGSMVLLLGGSGAGKTTLLNAINGYEKAKAEVVLNGGNIYNEYKKMQYEVGFVPQQDLMRGSDTVQHTLMDAAMLRLPRSFSRAERADRVSDVLEIFGLGPVRGSLVEKLSGGQRKRLSIAMEFLSNPSLFILDEPDSGLDGVMARELMQQLRSIADQGKIIIVITHTPDRVIDLFDDVIVLAKDARRTGRLAYYGSIEKARTFFERDQMEQIVMRINRVEEGGEGLADEFIRKYAEVQHG